MRRNTEQIIKREREGVWEGRKEKRKEKEREGGGVGWLGRRMKGEAHGGVATLQPTAECTHSVIPTGVL